MVVDICSSCNTAGVVSSDAAGVLKSGTRSTLRRSLCPVCAWTVVQVHSVWQAPCSAGARINDAVFLRHCTFIHCHRQVAVVYWNHVWSRSSHVSLVDSQLNNAMRLISGCVCGLCRPRGYICWPTLLLQLYVVGQPQTNCSVTSRPILTGLCMPMSLITRKNDL